MQTKWYYKYVFNNTDCINKLEYGSTYKMLCWIIIIYITVPCFSFIIIIQNNNCIVLLLLYNIILFNVCNGSMNFVEEIDWS